MKMSTKQFEKMMQNEGHPKIDGMYLDIWNMIMQRTKQQRIAFFQAFVEWNMGDEFDASEWE